MTVTRRDPTSPEDHPRARRGAVQDAPRDREQVVERIDHVAIEVREFDETIERMERVLGMQCARIGRLMRDPSRRIAVVRDTAGFTLEIIEAPVFHRGGPTLDHLAFRVRDVSDAHDALAAEGFQSRLTTRHNDMVGGDSAVLTDPIGLVVQIVRYDDGSTAGA